MAAQGHFTDSKKAENVILKGLQLLTSQLPMSAAGGKQFELSSTASIDQDPHHILNSLDESESTAVFELRTVPIQPSDSYFVTSVILNKHLSTPLETALWLACLSGPCIVPRVRSFRDKACFVTATSDLCKQAHQTPESYSALCSIHFSLLNMGAASSPALDATIALPISSSMASLHLDSNTSVEFVDYGVNYELNIRKYKFTAPLLQPNGSSQFTALVACTAVDGSAISISMTGIDSKPRKLYFSSGTFC